MICSGCGKDIPFVGTVCPFCQRDKSKDQQSLVLGIMLGLIFGFFGYLMFSFWGAVIGFISGVIFAVVKRGNVTSPPEVRISNQTLASVSSSGEARLQKIKELLDKGLINEIEYNEKKKEILDDI